MSDMDWEIRISRLEEFSKNTKLIFAKHGVKKMISEMRELWEEVKQSRAQHGANLTQLAKSKIDQMGGTVCDVLVRNEAGALASVSDLGRVTWLDGADSGEAVEILSGPHTHVCWTPDAKPKDQREKVVLIRYNDFLRVTKPPANQVPDEITQDLLNAIWQDGFDSENYDDRECCQQLIVARNAVEESTQPDAGAGQWINQAREVLRIQNDLQDFDGDRRGIYDAYGQAKEKLVDACLKSLLAQPLQEEK